MRNVERTQDVLTHADNNRHHARLSRRLKRMGFTGGWAYLGTNYADLADCARVYPNVREFMAHFKTHRKFHDDESSGDSDH